MTAELIIETTRLRLTRLTIRDAGAVFAYRSLPEICRFQSFRPAAVADAAAFIAGTADRPDIPGTWFQLGIFLREGQVLIGDIGVHFLPRGEAELGYTVTPSFQKRGYAAEAATAVISWLFRSPNRSCISCTIDPDNAPSLRLAKRLGLKPAGKSVHQELIFKIERGEWSARGVPV
ncbi:GNAT family N-acetyltransferase [Dehalogenimonas alkenigignens]|uniref:GNAT family N-acetyltransferase n=1 Tax=Dehalogenimonas alkenigignens TaxID=1217799 RepID=UPI000D56D404|nr:GNAT family N-acetyltransferase [Dehalogenimonas alkenigignens]PVV84387.1 GNAT family N-acetyltransferase [Dehalogenimonas alkenigignens]